MARTKTRPIGRAPIKRQACEAWLAKQLAGRPCPAQNILEFGLQSGWGWATVRRAKANIGARSFKQGHQWWWFDPSTYTPVPAPPSGFAKKTPLQSPQIPEKIQEIPAPVEQPSLPRATASIAVQREAVESPQRTTSEIYLPDKFIENRSRTLAPPSPPPRQQEFPKPVVPSKPQHQLPKPAESPKPLEPPKPRRIRIWDSELAETREALIAAANFVDLYIMRADIRLRQEQLHAKGLLKEELALNDLVSRINEALENKKKAENLE
jgi:hypothetical protein